MFPYSRVITLPLSKSDHCPLLIEVSPEHQNTSRPPKRFRFEEMWLQHDDCSSIVERGWMIPATGQLMQQVGSKIRHTGFHLSKWNAGVFRQWQVEMKLIKGKLDHLMRLPFSSSHFDEQRALQTRHQELLSLNETYWRQRSRVQWLKEGDRNTSFFHRRASNRRCRNRVKGLTDSSGQWTSDPKEVADILISYYENIFKSEHVDPAALEVVLATVQKKVTTDMNKDLLAEYSDQEIRKALFQMHPSKSPGPDGMSPCFFQKFWHIVGFDVCKAVREVLVTGQVSHESNFTHLTLIPKIPEPQLAADLRPIALCNVVYKIASKVLANRLKRVLPSIISPLQSAFVPGRLISDNTLVATEVAHFMKKLRQQAQGFFSLKLDISKAYDRLEWVYLEGILVKLGFARAWIDVVLATVKSASYSILINGHPTGFVTPTRGIRQGDPLSPYLFILCAEGLSSLISCAVQSGLVKGLKLSPTAPTIHHLFFADDSFLFGEASTLECQAVKSILNTYAQASGQRINLQKSSVVFSGNVHSDQKHQLADLLGVECVQEHGLYLGLPIQVGQNKTEAFAYLKERLSKKLVSWRTKILSAGGKETLIKVVAQTLPNYVMNCYLLPKGLCDDLQQLCCEFFWGTTEEKRKIHWRSWERMCAPKEAGGLGFKSLYAHNLAMLAKQGWRLLTHPNSLVAQVFKAVYYPYGSFLSADMGDRPSFSWRSIMNARPVIKAGLQWRIGSGASINIWEDDWIPNVRPHSIQRPHDSVFELVSDLIDEDTGRWNLNALHCIFEPHVVSQVLTIPLSRRFGEDRAAWKPTKNGFFSVKSAYIIARDVLIGHVFATSSSGDPYLSIWRALWKAKIPSKVAIFAWRAVHNLLPTRTALTNKGYHGPLSCCVCNMGVETSEHLFRDCSIAKEVFSAPPFSFGVAVCSWKDWILDKSQVLSSHLFDKFLIVLWSLWLNRNNMLWKNKGHTVHSLISSSMTWYNEFLQASASPQKSAILCKQKGMKHWVPPSEPSLKLNSDGAFLPGIPFGGVGGVVRNAMGQFQAGFSARYDFITSPFHAELIAIQHGLQMVQAFHWDSVIVETDCMQAVTTLTSSIEDLSPLGALISDIKASIHSIPNCSIVFAPREANVVAHRLASHGYENNVHMDWFVNAPAFFQDALLYDTRTY